MHRIEEPLYKRLREVKKDFTAKPPEEEGVYRAVRAAEVVTQAAKQGLLLAQLQRGSVNPYEDHYHIQFANRVLAGARASREPFTTSDWRTAVRRHEFTSIVFSAVKHHYHNVIQGEIPPARGWILPIEEFDYENLYSSLPTSARDEFTMSRVILGDLYPEAA